ncbi:class I SAM-dependent methyltransferase [Glycomyces sp. MUSA5-2]|uniref:class I SAM-dependent methyltransferase n=1 Tax=Glycomyces sp. MUSA5-2 TaxID=2053002 RepID=UPI00300AD082
MSYDDIAAIYNSAYQGEEFRREDRLVRRALRRFVPHGARVLDVGCGTGKGVELLPESVNYVGLDLSGPMLDVARAAFPGRSFVQGDARSMPFQDETFDVAISTFGALSHVLEIELALAETARVLRRNGRAFLMVYGLDRQTSPDRRNSEVVAYTPRGAEIPDGFAVDARLYSAYDIRKLLSVRFHRMHIRGLTLLRGRGANKSKILEFLSDSIDATLCSIYKDHAHTLCIRIQQS